MNRDERRTRVPSDARLELGEQPVEDDPFSG
jgi:hypothetical protein